MKPVCPQCGNASSLTPDNPARPFCSERCRLIDLGAWADGSYSIPVVEADRSVDTDGEAAVTRPVLRAVDTPE
jgi:hypothetical protein